MNYFFDTVIVLDILEHSDFCIFRFKKIKKDNFSIRIQSLLCSRSRSRTFYYSIFVYFFFQTYNGDQSLCRSHANSMLPLIFGLPFAPELKNPYQAIEGQQASLARKILTYWANFAATGYV